MTSFTVTGSSLSMLKPGEKGIVARIQTLKDSLQQEIRSLNINPGTTIIVEQRFPRFLVRIGTTQLVLTPEILNAIYVRLPS